MITILLSFFTILVWSIVIYNKRTNRTTGWLYRSYVFAALVTAAAFIYQFKHIF